MANRESTGALEGAGIPPEAFEQVLQQAIIRPAGRQFRGEPARQVEILRLLRQSAGRVPFDEIHRHLRRQGVIRSAREDDPARRKGIAQAVEAINTKLGTFFFQARDPALLEEMFRVRVHAEDASRPAYSLHEFFEVRRLSGVRFYATAGRAGGLTQELLEIVRSAPQRIDMMSPSLESFFGNPEFRSMLTHNLQGEIAGDTGDAPRVRVLLLDPDAPAAARLERLEREEAPVMGSLRDRIRATLAHAVDIVSALPTGARDRFAVRVSDVAPLWRFRMIFLPELLHLRLANPGGASETLIKLGVASALYTSLHDVFEQQWTASGNGGPAAGRPTR